MTDTRQTHLLRVAPVIDDLDHHAPIHLHRFPRQLCQGVGDQPGRLRVHPEVGGQEDLLFCSGDDIGHVADNIRDAVECQEGRPRNEQDSI